MGHARPPDRGELLHRAVFPEERSAPNWREIVSQDLLNPRFTISFVEAVIRRLGRSYIWIYILLFLAWILKLILFPEPTSSFVIALQRASVFAIPGAVIAGAYLVVILGIVLVFLFSIHSYGIYDENLPSVVMPTASDEKATPQRPR